MGIKFRRGFTLAEVLTVLTIIVIVCCVLMPAILSAKSSAKMASSSENLHQLSLAAILYSGDNDDLLPFYRNNEVLLLTYDPNVTTSGIPTDSKMPQELTQSLSPYLHSESVWFCTSDPYLSTGTPFGELNHAYSSYLYTALPPDLHSPVHWPIVSRLSRLALASSLFVEPIGNTGSGLHTYWKNGVSHAALSDGSIQTSHISSTSVGPP